MVPEVYDLMGQVQALMVRSQAAPVRQSCSAVRRAVIKHHLLSPSSLCRITVSPCITAPPVFGQLRNRALPLPRKLDAPTYL